MKKVIKALSKLVKNIHIKCTSKCCACDSDCNNPKLEAIDDIIEEVVGIAAIISKQENTKITEL